MPVTEKDKAVIPDIVDAFSLAIIEVCQTLEHQRTLPLDPSSFVGEFEMRATSLPDDQSGKVKKHILMNIANGLKGKPLSPFHVS